MQSLLDARCLRCHADPAPAAGWNAGTYLGAIGCTQDGTPVTVASSNGRAPLVDVLDRVDHARVLATNERTLLASWVETGASRSGSGVHSSGFADPRSPGSHGRFLRARRYAPMTDATDADACGTCHDGAPARRAEITRPAPDAPACTTCHAEPEGPLACGTCHGNGPIPYPPRNRCFFPADRDDRAHAAHAGPSPSRAAGLACGTCHPTPATTGPLLPGVHANGYVDVWFDFMLAGRAARFEARDRRCSGTCHARGGMRPEPTWDDAPMGCNDCHSSPPPEHYRGACSSCHREANAEGSALKDPVLHANGKVDLGDGSGRCGACHGQGDDPWPSTGAHQAHAHPKDAKPVACETCHDMPSGKHPLGTGGPTVRLLGLAAQGGRRATFDPTSKTCASTYCHEGPGGSAPSPRWTDGSPLSCNSCHASPPAPPHVQSTTCNGAACHEGRTNELTLTAAGRLAHVDGTIDRGIP